jgi:serine kinase of HPr protein (carbohydrate metabolism regulator)
MACIKMSKNFKYSTLILIYILIFNSFFFQIDLTFDDETRHYTNLSEYFSLFGNKKIHICGRNFIGYVQDVSNKKKKKNRFFNNFLFK